PNQTPPGLSALGSPPRECDAPAHAPASPRQVRPASDARTGGGSAIPSLPLTALRRVHQEPTPAPAVPRWVAWLGLGGRSFRHRGVPRSTDLDSRRWVVGTPGFPPARGVDAPADPRPARPAVSWAGPMPPECARSPAG